MVIDARDCDAGPFPTLNPLVGCKTLVEHKTLASLLVSVQARVKKVQTDIQKRAEELDSRHPGSTFAQELRAYGPYLVLVTGPFGNLSSDFKTFVDFIARERAMQTMALRNINPALALAVHRRALVRRIGLLTSRGWAQHIVDRWRDAVSNRPTVPHHVADIDLAADEFLSTTRTVADTTACTCPVLKHLAHFFLLIVSRITIKLACPSRGRGNKLKSI